jgi:methionyl-tRNA formyltransferase
MTLTKLESAPLRVAILTTETLHHAYFVREIVARYPATQVFCETGVLAAPFETSHPYEAARSRYEQEHWFDGCRGLIADFAEVETFSSINDDAAMSAVCRFDPDVLVDFGTGKVKEPLLSFKAGRLFNLHGGDPQHYRGLDSHLWAIYHNDFSGLVTTLHRLTSALDAGDIVHLRQIPLRPEMSLHELRAANTKVCVDLTLAALDQIADAGDIRGTPQVSKGRYYSFMPAVLKEICVRKFERYTHQRLRSPGVSGMAS